MDLQDSSQIPLYNQLKQVIKEDIRTEKYRIGEQLPTELKLCEKYNVSRVTVRRAIKELVQEKILYRKQGKGTFVSEAKIKRELISLGSFSDLAIQSGQEPSSKIIEYKIKKMDKQTACLFNEDINNEVLVLKRILNINEEPFIIEKSYLPINRFPGIENYINENVSIYKILRNYYDTGIVKADKTLDITLANAEQAEIFNCDLNEIMYLLKKNALTKNDEIVHISESIILGSKVTFTFSVEK